MNWSEVFISFIEASPVLAFVLVVLKYLVDMINKLIDRLERDEAERAEIAKTHNKQNELLNKMLMKIEQLDDKTDVVSKVKEMLRDERK